MAKSDNLNAQASQASANNPTPDQKVATDRVIDPMPGPAAANPDQTAPLVQPVAVQEADYEKAYTEGGLTDPRSIDPNRRVAGGDPYIPDRMNDGSSRTAGGDKFEQLLQVQIETNRLLLEAQKRSFGDAVSEYRPEGEHLRLLAAAQVNAEVAASQMSDGVPGGAFMVPEGYDEKGKALLVWVNASGERIDDPYKTKRSGRNSGDGEDQ